MQPYGYSMCEYLASLCLAFSDTLGGFRLEKYVETFTWIKEVRLDSGRFSVRIWEIHYSPQIGDSSPPSAHFVRLAEIKVSDRPLESNGFPK